MTTPENVSSHAPLAGGQSRSSWTSGAWRDWVLGGLWVLMAPVSVYAPKGTVVLLILFLLALPDHRWAAREAWAAARRPLGLVVGLFLGLAAVSAIWAPDPVGALIAAGKLTLLTVAGVLVVVSMASLRGRALARTEQGLYVSVVLMGVLLGMEYLTGGTIGSLVKGVDQSNLVFTSRGSSTLAVMALPVATLLLRRGATWSVVALFAIVFVILTPLPMLASLLALAAGLLVFGLTWWIGAKGLVAVMAVAGTIAFASPWIFKDAITLDAFGERAVDVPISWQHRLGIWTFVGQRSLERPMLGHGFDSSRVIGREPGMVPITTHTQKWEQKRLPLHPHSIALQLWLELGAFGVLAMLTILGVVTTAVIRHASDRRTLAGLAGGLVTVWALMSVSFGAWQSAWVAVVWLCVAAYAMSTPRVVE